ncbi:hypothetical protein [Flavivirga eckloniae]|uniref:Uncharacterized protein n=1 Tax=Flavivirga eckloniae TaxID=1803846 RepID=A0A2K9PT14_9FLAO|nr:hypothetical protein [Flavivirga eckloniae]AUP79687.1 hypothetical protein C1H87_13610 [Flavivirga eckloniae]
MDKIIEDYVKSLEKKKTMFLVEECLKSLKEDEIIINKDAFSTIKRLFSFYTDKYNVQQEILKNKKIIDYELLLNELKKYSDDLEVETSILSNFKNGFIILQLRHSGELIGILKSHKVNLDKSKDLIRTYKNKGLTLNYYYFNKGNLIRIIN